MYLNLAAYTAYLEKPRRRTSFGFHPFQFSYPPRKLTMEEMLYKFIDEGIREHEEIGAFIREFKTTNELLLKESNNSWSELKFEVYGFSKAINNTQSSNYKVKGVTTRGGKTTTEINRDINNVNKELPVLHHDKPVEPNEVVMETKPQETKEQTILPSTQSILFPYRTRHKRQYDIKVNKRKMQTHASKVDSSKVLDADLVVMESNGTESGKQDTTSSLGNYLTHVVDADIRPVNDQIPFAEVQLSGQHNVLANEQQHTE
nr:hypothetical protein [Tanacetum cinerariifolium]